MDCNICLFKNAFKHLKNKKNWIKNASIVVILERVVDTYFRNCFCHSLKKHHYDVARFLRKDDKPKKTKKKENIRQVNAKKLNQANNNNNKRHETILEKNEQ